LFARDKDEPDDGWTSEVSSSFALAGFLGLVFLALTLLAIGPLAKFDAYFNLAPPPPSWRPWLHVVDRVGQRAVCVPILAVVAYLLCRRTESWRPAVVAAVAVFVLNLVVLVLKVGLGRGAPLSADPSFFAGGMAFPSGHSANIVLVYGMIAYLLLTYGQVGRRTRVLLWLMVPVLALIMVLTSMTLNWHWFSDLVAGLLVGGMVLQLAAAVDLVVPDTGYAHGFRAGTRELVDFLRRRSTGGPADPA
jgi:membrane-associated phospholipid phosphatase